ncbi:MAG: hypothetical protein Q4E62_05035, partial [Sutterellaceae bacterium]|nr:hypothetical protein [Sutterellaceae bacterium]
MSSSSKGLCRVAIMPRSLDVPPALLSNCVNDEALARAETLTNDKRRADFLWGRTLLTHLLKAIDADASLVERAPKTPLIVGSATPLFATISHTATWIGVAVADAPVAIDLEVMAEHRAKPAIFDRVFGVGAWEQYAQDDPIGLFYKTWGLYECGVKLEGKLSGLAHEARVHLTDDTVCRHVFYTLPENTLLTVAGAL